MVIISVYLRTGKLGRFWALKDIFNIEDLSEEYIIPLGYFTIETFPRMDKLNFIANYSEMKKLGNLPPRVLNEYWEPATWALAKEHNLSETYPLRLCLKCSDCLEKIKELKDATNN